jgi:polysaccharide biosynthesis/export protein PslD
MTRGLRSKHDERRIRPSVVFRAVQIVFLALALTACESTRSSERVATGSIVYFDELSEAQKAEARDRIAHTLNRGLDVYGLKIGDEIEILFHLERAPTSRPYAIRVTDKLRIEFVNDTDNNRTVQVRPDGRISVPLLGSVMAAGKTIDALARELEHRYTGVLSQPQVTINATETHTWLEDLVAAIGPNQQRRSITDKVLPDGTISLPLLRPIQARGRTLRDLEHEIDVAYSAKRLDISVSLIPRNLRVGTALVLGEVGKPGRIDSDRPQTVLMAVAQAGGVTTQGSLEAIRVFYVGDDGLPRIRSVNLKDVLEELKLEEDMIVPSDAVIYVPPTELAKTGRFLDAVLRDILRFQGFNIGGNYIINNPSSGAVVVGH